MYTRILVPVDGSSTSDRGLDEAVKLARLTGARLRLLHVVDLFTYATGMDGFSMTADLVPVLREAGEKLLKAVLVRSTEAPASEKSRTGALPDAVSRHVE